MPLFDPDREVAVAPEDAVHVVHDFLLRCRAWAIEREIPKRLQRVEADQDPAEAAKLHGWITWRRFCEHALREIEDGTLDAWFDGDSTDAESPAYYKVRYNSNGISV